MSSGGFRELADRLLSLLYPPRCVLCGRVTAYDDLWCGRCPYPQAPEEWGGQGLAPFAYREDARMAVLRLKTVADQRTAAFLAEAMADCCRRNLPRLDAPGWTLVPVPIHPEGLKKRGFNQAELLARALGKQLELPVETGLLRRLHSPVAQHTLGLEARFHNAVKSYRPVEHSRLPPGRRIILVDDVITTGATAAACTRCLLDLGADRVAAVAATATEPEID